jgi:hypothetical protein
MSGRIREKDLKLIGEFDIELGNCNFPFGGLLLQAIQVGVGIRCISFEGDKQLLGFLKLALPPFLLLQKLSNLALQLLHLSFVGSIPVVQPLGHIHRGYAVLVACLQGSFLICKNLKLKEGQDRKQ